MCIRDRLERVLRLAGGQPLHTDRNLWCWFVNNTLAMLLSTHVDDLKGSGEKEVVSRVKAILTKEFGALKEAYDTFIHCGIEHETKPDCIELHQTAYAKQLKLMDHVKLTALSTTQSLDELMTAQYQSLLGALSWLTQTRMEVCVYVCALQLAAKSAKVEHALRLNKVCLLYTSPSPRDS